MSVTTSKAVIVTSVNAQDRSLLHLPGSVTCHKTSISDLGRLRKRVSGSIIFDRNPLCYLSFEGNLDKNYMVPKWWIWVINWACGGVFVKFSVVCACSRRGTQLRKKAPSTHFSTLLIHYFACRSWKPITWKQKTRGQLLWSMIVDGLCVCQKAAFPINHWLAAGTPSVSFVVI